VKAVTALAPQAQPDSPLVAAAKRANRLGKRPGVVITNDSVTASKGHVSTSTMIHTANVPEPELGPEAKIAQANAAKAAQDKRVRDEAAAKEKKVAEEKARRAAEAAAAAEEGYDTGHDDADGYMGGAQTETKPPQF
jgi:hypothetical protein